MSRRIVAVLVGCALVLGATYALTGGEDQEDAPAGAGDTTVRRFLAPWYDAVRRQARQPAKVVFVGDSISEGALLDSPVHEHRMVGLLQDRLRERAGIGGGAGYLPAYYADWFTPDDTVRSGTPAHEAPFEKWGLGGRALLMPHGAVVTYPPLRATRVRVWFGLTSYLGGRGRVLVDGKDVTADGTLSTGARAADTIDGSTPEGSRSGLWWESPPLGDGVHEVRVESVERDAVFVHTGVEVLSGDVDSGIHVYDASHSGATATDFTGVQVVLGHWADVAAVDPDLLVVNLGSNPDPDFAAGLASVVELALEAAPRARVLLVDGYRPGGWSVEDWRSVREAREEVAAAHPGRVAVFDLAAHWPRLTADGSTSAGLMVEEELPLHPNAAGNRRMAEIFADLLSPAAAH